MLSLAAAPLLNWHHPLLIVALYGVTSAIAFGLYAFDKFAAQNGRRRVPENALHLWGLLGGWPGALAAQQLFRHKTRKLSFQIVFWFTVALNCFALAWVLSQSGTQAHPDPSANSGAASDLPRITPATRSTRTR